MPTFAESSVPVDTHGDLLANKVIVYKHLEHWTVSPAGLRQEDADTAELAG